MHPLSRTLTHSLTHYLSLSLSLSLSLLFLSTTLDFVTTTYLVLGIITLLVPPSYEEGYLDVDECAILIHQQLLNDSV